MFSQRTLCTTYWHAEKLGRVHNPFSWSGRTLHFHTKCHSASILLRSSMGSALRITKCTSAGISHGTTSFGIMYGMKIKWLSNLPGAGATLPGVGAPTSRVATGENEQFSSFQTPAWEATLRGRQNKLD